MPGSAVSFYSEGVNFSFNEAKMASGWVKEGIRLHNKQCGSLSFIFVSDQHLLEINRQYLDHDDFTDVITFDYTEGETVSGDIFISVDRVRENAIEFNEPFLRELSRVIIHGTLHLLGFKDKSAQEREIMRNEEEKLLNLCPYLNRST